MLKTSNYSSSEPFLIGCGAPPCTRVVQAIEAILQTKQFLVLLADQVKRASRILENEKADFADCLMERSASGAGCAQTLTFDMKAAKHAGMTLTG